MCTFAHNLLTINFINSKKKHIKFIAKTNPNHRELVKSVIIDLSLKLEIGIFMTVDLYPHKIKDSEAKRNTGKYGPLNERAT